MKYLDAHTHAHFAAYDADRSDVLARAKQASVAMINVGTGLTTSAAAVRLAEENESLWATVGLHPIHASESHDDGSEGTGSEAEEFVYEKYLELAKHNKVVGIGECGLDYFRIKDKDLEIKNKQKEIFLAQMKLAKEVQKPLMIHCRAAFPDLVKLLKENKSELNSVPGITHFFAGTPAEAKELLDLGFYFTFGGVITFVRDYDEVINLIPLDRIMSETDAPYVTPVPYRGKRNEPSYVIEVVKKLAELKKVSVDTIAEQIWLNAEKVFSIKNPLDKRG
jgi:TatD DNase family protein